MVPADGADLHVGHVITYRIPVQHRRVVTHRIVEVVHAGVEPTVITQGDANNGPDNRSVTPPEGSAYRLVASVPYLGYLLRACRTRASPG